MMLSEIRRFQIIGLNHYRDFEISFEEPCKILVGENGLGKTTIMNVFYYVLTRKWMMLDKVEFDFIELEVGKTVIEFSQSDLRMFVSSSLEDDGYIDPESVETFKSVDTLIQNLDLGTVLYFPVVRNLDLFVIDLFELSTYDLIKRRKSIDIETKNFVSESLIFNAEKIQQRFTNFIGTARLREFKSLCNKYLVETRFEVDGTSKLILINKNNLETVSVMNLSSGEKQIINFFARVYLTDQTDLTVLIDEPEISLSINWQSALLPDIISSKNCALLFVITHSPFTFKNSLDKYAVPMGLFTRKL